MSFWTPAELAAMDVVKFKVNDRGKTVEFSTPNGAKCKVVANPRPLEWQVTQGIGLDGASTKFRGTGVASGTITLTMGGVEEGQFQRQEYDTFCRKYLRGPSRGQPAPVFDVSHPRFARYNPPLTKLHLKDDPAGDWDENTQIETVVFTWEEDRKPSPTLSSPSTAGAGKDGAKAQSKTTEALKKSIEQEAEQTAALSKTLAEL